MTETFTEEQKRYLEGFAAATMLAAGPPTAALAPAPAGQNLPVGPEVIHFQAQDRITAAGGKLCPEELAKRKRFPLDVWDDMCRHARENVPPKGTDVLAFKYHGLFWVAPAQHAFMSRLRFPGGICPSYQLRGVADLAEKFGGGYADVTTRANLQIREIKPADGVKLEEGLHDLGIINRGAGADNIRNVTGSATAGIDPLELIDTRPLTHELHHYILNHREMYGLPRKFNIGYDGGGAVATLEDTNDIAFTAVRVAEGKSVPAGVYFRLRLGGITGHKDFARDTGIGLTPSECLPAAVAIVRVFIDHGDRTDRKKARLKYLLDQWGFEKFLSEVEKQLGSAMRKLPLEDCEPQPQVVKHGHIGVFPQKQPGLSYVGVALPMGRTTSAQMRGLADIADRHGSRTIRLTVWQNLIISDIPNEKLDAVQAEICDLGLSTSTSHVRAGLIACTGAAGCKYALAHTKQDAARLGDYLDAKLELDQPINIHLTGCPHSCAQHYIGDIGCIGTKVTVGEDSVEGYHIFVGGGYGATQGIGREMRRDVVAEELPLVLEKMLRGYLDGRKDESETFVDFVKRHETDQLKDLFERRQVVMS